MELRHLVYFKTVAEELHFRRAADKLFISQPPLSRQIKELEEELGAILFDRKNKKVALTPAGEYFKNEIDKLFSALEESKYIAKTIHGSVNGNLRIGYISSTFHIHLGIILKEIHRVYPFVKTKLYEIPTVKQVHALENGKLDIGIIRMPMYSPDLNIRTLYIDSFAIAIPAVEDSFNNLNEVVDYIKDQPFIFFNKDYAPDFYQKLQDICQRLGFVPEIVHEANNIHSILKLVENKLGVSIVPASIQQQYHSLQVRYFDLSHLPVTSEVILAFKEPLTNPALQLFIEQFTRLFKK